MRRGGPRLLAAAVAAALLPAPSAQAEEVRAQRVRGETVFVLKPTRRPEGSPTGLSAARAAAPAGMDVIISEVSSRHGLDPRLVTTVIGVESNFNALAVSPKGARGLMQLMPATAREYGVRNVHDPRENIEGGVAYLRELTRRYGGDLRLALAAYNAGPEAVERASGVPNYRETREYLRKIESRYGALGPAGGAAGGPPGGSGAWIRPAGGTRIRAVSGQDGEITFTNAKGPGLRVMPRK